MKYGFKCAAVTIPKTEPAVEPAVEGLTFGSAPVTEVLKDEKTLIKCIALYRLLLVDQEQYHAKCGIGKFPEPLDKDIENMFKTFRQFVFAKCKGEIVGMCTIRKSPYVKTFSLSNVVMDKDFRGRGIGKKMCEFALNSLQGNNVDLSVSMANPHAYKLYTSLGFTPTDVKMIRVCK